MTPDPMPAETLQPQDEDRGVFAIAYAFVALSGGFVGFLIGLCF